MLEPFVGTNNTGLQRVIYDDYVRAAQEWAECGYQVSESVLVTQDLTSSVRYVQVNTHAIGDRAIRIGTLIATFRSFSFN